MNVKQFLATIASTLLLSACGGGGSKYIDQDLAGKIGGADFTYVSGSAKIDSFDSTKLSIVLGAVAPADPCDDFANFGTSKVMTSVPDEVQANTLGLSQTVTLFDGTTNAIATEGEIEVLTRSSTEVQGRLRAKIDSDDEVNGNFTVVFCP